MSLLMDALKKAEQEKKEAAKRLQEAQEKTEGRIQLQEKETSKITEPKKKAGKKKKELPASIPEKKTTSELSLSPLDQSTPDVQEKSEPVSESDNNQELESEEIELSSDASSPSLALKMDVTIDHPDISDLDEGIDEDDDKKNVIEDHSSRKPDRTFALEGLSIEKESAKPFDDTANATLQEKNSVTISDSRISKSIISAADLVKDIGGGREAPTPVAAQTVFKASARNSGRQQVFEWSMFIGLLIIIMVAAGSFYYLKITPLTPKTSSPMVAKGIETDPTPEINLPVPENIGPADISDEVNIGEETGEISGNIKDSAPENAGLQEEQAEVSATISENIEATPEISGLTSGAEIPQDESVSSQMTVIPDQGFEIEKSLPEKIEVAEKVIAISHSKSVDKNDQLVNVAYSYYANGDYSGAEKVYREVLNQHPENRDALLGMAAIAYRKGNLQYAYEQYLKVLKLYPKDIVAKTALVSMQENVNTTQSESIIKLMIQEQPDTAYLYFALGNIYARQNKWADAQQAFFEAYRLQPENTDYVYNLAVSLDHLGQVKSASEYYTRAIDLADESQPAFNTASVISRLNSLSLNTRAE